MTNWVALLNLILGLAYTGYGIMTALEMKRDWASFGVERQRHAFTRDEAQQLQQRPGHVVGTDRTSPEVHDRES